MEVVVSDPDGQPVPSVSLWVESRLRDERTRVLDVRTDDERDALRQELRMPGPDRLRYVAHRISDIIYEALTGEPGAFARSAATSLYSCIPRPVRNTRWRAPNANPAAATPTSRSTAIPP